MTRRCPGCRRPSRSICGVCRRLLAEAAADGAVLRALARQVGVEQLIALWDYEPVSRSVILALKNRSRTDLATLVAPALALRVGSRPDVVSWVPASGRGRRRRGYDQSELIARRVGRNLGVPVRRLLARADPGGGHTRTRAERLHGPSLAARRVRITARTGPPAPRVLLIDDVVTTGGSLTAAVAALRSGGIDSVDAAVLAAVHDCRSISLQGRRHREVAAP